MFYLCNAHLCLQQVRGGHTKLAHITAPQSDFGGDGSKTDALHAMELSLSFEKLNFQKLKELQGIAEKNSDAQMSDFVEAMLQEQVCVIWHFWCGCLVLLPLTPVQYLDICRSNG